MVTSTKLLQNVRPKNKVWCYLMVLTTVTKTKLKFWKKKFVPTSLVLLGATKPSSCEKNQRRVQQFERLECYRVCSLWKQALTKSLASARDSIDRCFDRFQNNDGFSWVGSESPFRAELPSADLHSLFFQIHPRWRFFINNFYLISSHRLKSISGTIIIIVNNNNFDFIAILLLAGGLKTTAEWLKFSVDF